VAGVFIPVPYSIYNITNIVLYINALWLFSFFLNKKSRGVFAASTTNKINFPGQVFRTVVRAKLSWRLNP
jgi:hypothetical protein